MTHPFLRTIWFAPLLITISGLLGGCAELRQATLAESPALNMPLHSKREFIGQIGYGGRRGFDLLASYSITRNWAVGVSMVTNHQSFRNSSLFSGSSDYEVNMSRFSNEGQLTYLYNPGGESWYRKSWEFSVGFGSGNRQMDWLRNRVLSNWNRYFGQVVLNAVTVGRGQLGVGIKLHQTHYKTATKWTSFYPLGQKIYEGPKGAWGIDFAQTYRLALGSVAYLNGQFGFYLPFNSVKLSSSGGGEVSEFNNSGLIVSVGLTLIIPPNKQPKRLAQRR